MADKKIKLYKVNSDGTLDKDSKLLPETNIESVQGLNEELSGKIGTNDYLNNYKYDKIEKTIIVPGEIVDGETYELPTEYDLSQFAISDYQLDLYVNDTTGERIFIDNNADEYIIVYKTEPESKVYVWYYYMDLEGTVGWYVGDGQSQPSLYEGDPIEVTINEDSIITENTAFLSKVLGIESTEETVEIERTLNDVKEDLPNWTYEDDGIGLYDVPKWDSFNVSEEYGDGTIYEEDTPNRDLEVLFYKDGEHYNITINDNDSNTQYWITNFDYTEYNQQANIWYYWEKSTEKEGECDTPKLTFKEEYIVPEYIDIFNSIYGEIKITLGQKIDSLEEKIDEPLKDKTYDTTPTQIVQTLEQKFEEEANKPLKDKPYEAGDIYYQPLYQPSNETLDLIVNRGGNSNNPHLVYEDNNLIIETYNNSFSMQLFQYYRFVIGDDIYQGSSDYNGWKHTDDNWSTQDMIYSQEDLPKITFDKQYITSGDEELFNGLIYSKNSTVTLGQKLGSFKDWTYEDHPAILIEGEDYQLLDSYSDDFFTKYADLFITGAGTNIYSDGFYTEIDLVKINVGIEIPFILFNNTDMNICVAYIKMPEGVVGVNDGWYEAEWDNELDGWNLITPPTPASAPTLISLNILSIAEDEEETLKDILGIVGSVTTVDDKFNEPLKDKIYESEAYELVNGESYNFEEVFTLDSLEDRVIYDDSSATVEGTVNYINVYNNYLWVSTVPPQNALVSPFGYNLLTNEWEEDSYQYLPTFVFNSSATVSDEESLKVILGLGSKNITLEEKLNSILPPVDTTTQGTYILKAVVDGSGNVTYSWVLETV